MRLKFKTSIVMCGLVVILLVPGALLAEPERQPLSGCAASPAPMTPANLLVASVAPIEMASRPCCLDEWQGGGLCPSGYRIASYCSSPGCESCGTFFCYSGLCYQ